MLAPEAQVDTIQGLWKDQYLCQLRHIDTVSQEEIEYFGTPTCGIPEYDRRAMQTLVHRLLTPIQMMEFYKDNKIVRLVNTQDALFIYNHLDLHMKKWRQQIESGVNNRNAPVEDLLIMDQFAKSLYPYASRYFPRGTAEEVQTQFDRTLTGGVITIRREDIVGVEEDITTVNKIDKSAEQRAQQHTSMADVFASRIAASTRGGRWK